MSQAEQEPRRTDLSDMVRQRRAELNLSLRAFAERCIDPATGEQRIHYSWIDRLEGLASVKPPQLPELRALAAGLGEPLGIVQDAAGRQFFGIDTVNLPGGHARALLHQAERLSEEDLEKVIKLIEVWGASGGHP